MCVRAKKSLLFVPLRHSEADNATMASTMAVIRYPFFKHPKNFLQAKAMVGKVLSDYKASLPPLPFQSTVKNPHDLITLMRSSSHPQLQQLSSTLSKSLDAAQPKKLADEKDVIFPVDLWKTVLPAVYVDAYKQYLDKRYNTIWERSDALPIAKEYVEYLNDQLPKMAAEYKEKLATYHQMVPRIQALERRLAALESNNISVESLFAENPEIANEIAEELERGDWSVDGSGKITAEDEHGHH